MPARWILLALVALAAFPSGAAAAPVVVLGHDGHVVRRDDPFVRGPAVTPALASASVAAAAGTGGRFAGRVHAAAVSSAGARARGARDKPRRRPAQITVSGALAGLQRRHAITPAVARRTLGAFNAALRAERHLSGTRRTELAAVTATMHEIAAARELTPSRLPALVATLNANRQWWTHGSLLSSYARVEFAGSQLLWEYYPGQGIQLQVLGTFAKADGLYTAGAADYPALTRLLSEMIPLASHRGGGLAWEYFFQFDGGSPPWTSAMSQATGLEALTRAYEATRSFTYLSVATRALPIFGKAPPVGVDVTTPLGARFLQYTFAPGVSIINAFLQTLIGLYDFGQVSGNRTAKALFAAGNAEAMAEVPRFDTGAWSLYQPGIEDSLSYHELVTGFLAELCQRTGAPVYCTTAQRFTAYLQTPPVIADLTGRARAGHAFALRFRLSKVSHVGVVVSAPGGGTVFSTSASFPYGTHAFAVPALRVPGTYAVRLAATGVAGNFSRTGGTLTVSR